MALMRRTTECMELTELLYDHEEFLQQQRQQQKILTVFDSMMNIRCGIGSSKQFVASMFTAKFQALRLALDGQNAFHK